VLLAAAPALLAAPAVPPAEDSGSDGEPPPPVEDSGSDDEQSPPVVAAPPVEDSGSDDEQSPVEETPSPSRTAMSDSSAAAAADSQAAVVEVDRHHDSVQRRSDAPKWDDVRRQLTAEMKFASGLPHHLPKRMKMLLLVLYPHAMRIEVDGDQLNMLIAECIANSESTLGENYSVIAPALGREQRDTRIEHAENNFARAQTDAQRLRLAAALETQKSSSPEPTLCERLQHLVAILDGESIAKLSQQAPGYEVVSHFGATQLDKLMKKHGLTTTRAQWNAQWLAQYGELREVFAEEYRLITAIPPKMIRAWLKGDRKDAPVDGKAFWEMYAKRCGFVDGEGNALPFDERFHVDHIVGRAATRLACDRTIKERVLDHPDNYAIHLKVVNLDDMMKDVGEGVASLKQVIHGPVSVSWIRESIQFRSTCLENNATHMAGRLQDLGHRDESEKYLTSFQPRKRKQEDYCKRLVGSGSRRAGSLHDAFDAQRAKAAGKRPAESAAGAPAVKRS